MTRRERLEAKAERRREWAESRTKKASALRAVGSEYRHDWAFITQPGHIPARAAMNRRDEKAYEHSKMAEHHEQKAAGLEQQLERSIFSDDADAIEQLKAKLAKLEAKRDRMKAYNAAARKAAKLGTRPPMEQFFPPDERAEIVRTFELCPYHIKPGLPLPPYYTTNLGAEIRRAKQRIEEVKARQERTAEAEAAPGGVTIERHESVNWCRVTFADKPDREILDALRAASYRWGGGSWQGYLDRLPAIVSEAAQ